MAVHLAVAGGVLMVPYFVLSSFSHEMSWMRSGIELSRFLRISLPIFFFSDQTMQIVLLLICCFTSTVNI